MKLLEIRPNCEWCDKNLPPESEEANICSYECTYCTTCVEDFLFNVCPTCGGGFCRRPIRPKNAWRPDKKLGLLHHPASTARVHSKYSADEIRAHVERIRGIPPSAR